MEYLISTKRSNVLLLIDFEKAFDSIDHTYIKKILHSYNFGDDFHKWFDVIYSDINSCVINNGHFSSFFKISRGCRQGDPLSPYLFILAAEPLARAIISNKNIKGIKIKNTEYKVGQYADDTFVLLEGKEHSLRATIHILQQFTECSGLKINLDKSNAVWIGLKAGSGERLCPDLGITWADNFTLLGINFDAKLQNMNLNNLEPKLLKIDAIFGAYDKWNLSLLGKICVIKTMVIPKFIHLLSILPNPEKIFLQKLSGRFKTFLWNDGKVRIKADQLAHDIQDGGLKLTNIELLCTSLKIGWVKKKYNTSGTWQTMQKEIMGENNIRQLWELDNESLIAYSRQIQNRFWKDVLTSWAQYVNTCDKTHFSNRPIWNSYFIKNKNLQNMKYSMHEKGCKVLSDLFDTNGNIYSYQRFCQKYNVNINFMDHMSLVNSIPRHWKNKIQEEMQMNNIVTDNYPDYVHVMLEKEKTCNYIYWELLPKLFVKNDNNIDKWCVILNMDRDTIIWQDIYKSAKYATQDSKLITFQYKLIRRILPTNIHLKLYKIKDNDVCDLCGESTETYEHLFVECPVSRSLIDDLISWMSPQYVLMDSLQSKNVIFGYFDRCSEDGNMINLLLLLYKYYIYKCKCKNTFPSFHDLLLDIKKFYYLEMSNQRYGKKWHNIQQKCVNL